MYRIGHWVLAVVLTFVFAKLGVFSVLIAFQKGVLLLALVVIAGLAIAKLWQRVFGQKNNPSINPSIKDRPHV